MAQKYSYSEKGEDKMHGCSLASVMSQGDSGGYGAPHCGLDKQMNQGKGRSGKATPAESLKSAMRQ